MTSAIFLLCPLHPLNVLIIMPHLSSPLPIHHQLWKPSMHQNQIPFGMITQTVTIPFLLPCRCSHLLFVHIIIPHPSSPLSINHHFWNLSIQHWVPFGMNSVLLPHRFSCLCIIHIIVPLPSSPLHMSKVERVTSNPSMSNNNPSSTYTSPCWSPLFVQELPTRNSIIPCNIRCSRIYEFIYITIFQSIIVEFDFFHP